MQKLIGLFFLAVSCSAQPERASDLLKAGEQANVKSNWDQGLTAYRKALALARAANDEAAETSALTGMAQAEFGRSHDDASEKLARESLAIAERMGDRAAIAAALYQLGSVQYKRGQYTELRPTLERTLALRQELGDHNGIAIGLNNMGNWWRLTGDNLLAIDYLTRAESEFSTLGNDRSRAVVLSNIGAVYADLGDYSRSLEFGRKALALAEAAKDDFHQGTILNVIAVTESYRGNYSDALRTYQKSLEIAKRANSLWSAADVQNNIGLVYQAQQNHEQAIAHFRQALEMNRAVGDASLDAEAHTNLGNEMLALNRLTEAGLEFRESLRISLKNTIQPMQAKARRGLGIVLFRSNRLAEADAELQKAADLQRAIPDVPNLAQTHADISRVRLKEGRAEDALDQARQSLQLLASIDRPEFLWQAQTAAGHALERQGRSDEAIAQFDASIATIESQRTRVAGPPLALPIYFADKLEPYQERVALALAAGKTEQALRFAEQSKSRALTDILRSGRVDLDKSLTSQEGEAQRQLQNRLAGLNIRLSGVQVSKQPDDSRVIAERDQVRREWDALQSELYAAHPETAFARGHSVSLTVDDIAHLAMDTKAVILDYFVTPQRAYLFVMKRGSAPRAVTLAPSPSALRAASAEFHRQLSSHDLNYAASSRELYRWLLAPVESDLAGEDAVIILPDGPLWDVAFQALQPAPNRFFIERAMVSYAPSLSVLRETMKLADARRAAPAGRELLALGNPAGNDLLPEAERQVKEIEKLYGPRQSRILVGPDASRARLTAESSNYRVVHLAAHAVLDSVNPMYSRALLARSATDSGMLEARELMQFNLKAELLVLSACETARGQATGGEGISGMLWAAFVAGAPTTVASMWRVESSSTSDLMIGFHRNWLMERRSNSPHAKAAALRQAARALIADPRYSHPFYWAAFVVMGSPF